MVAWRSAVLVSLAFFLAILVQRGSGDSDDFNLEDALKETSSVKQRWDHLTTTTTRRPGTTRAPAYPAGRWDHLTTTTTRRPGTTRAPAGSSGFSDKDLEDVLGGGEYKPDKNKGDGGYGSSDDPGSGMSAETGTIAGVASALAMALIGAVSSYISYQQKKFCFSIQPNVSHPRWIATVPHQWKGTRSLLISVVTLSSHEYCGSPRIQARH
uniref:CD99 antigen-like protein 2 n=1 Tax=Urocitellus parryii TaxID=9999 RepID=A0A8D2IA92_UROPR